MLTVYQSVKFEDGYTLQTCYPRYNTIDEVLAQTIKLCGTFIVATGDKAIVMVVAHGGAQTVTTLG